MNNQNKETINKEVKQEEMQLSDKVSAIRQLPDSDNKNTVVAEIRALRNFSPDERSSLFGNSDILWVIENYTIRELKDKAEKSLEKVEVQVGDAVRYDNISCVVLAVNGRLQDRLTLIFLREGTFYVVEGVSKYNVTVISHIDIDPLLVTLMK